MCPDVYRGPRIRPHVLYVERIQLWQMQIALNNMLSNDLELCDWALKNEVAGSWILSRWKAENLHIATLEQ